MSACSLKTAVVNPRKCYTCKKALHKTVTLDMQILHLQRANQQMNLRGIHRVVNKSFTNFAIQLVGKCK